MLPPVCIECPEERTKIEVGDAVVVCTPHGCLVRATRGVKPFDSWKGPPPSAKRVDS